MTIKISHDLILETDGSVSGLECGVRESGVTIARQGDVPKIHLLAPDRMRFAPSLYALVIGMADGKAVKTTSDGRVVVDPRLTDAPAVLAKVEAACGEERGRGGIPDGQHGVYDIGQARDGWHYVVQTTPSGRASLKKIATWTGINGRFLVPFSESAAFAAILERAVTAKVKGETTTIRLPEVPGVEVRIEGGEILICPPREDNDAIRAVPSTRWDPKRGAYAVSTRYSKRVAKALEEIKARVEERAAKAAEAEAAKKAEIDRIEADAPRIRTLMSEALAGCSIVSLNGRIATLSFPYDERSVAVARELPSAKYNTGARTWSVAAKTETDVSAIADGVKAIQARVDAAREAAAKDRVAKAEADGIEAADRKARGIGSYLEYARRAPAVGSVVLVDGRHRVVTHHGRSFVADEETSSMGGPIGAEGERLCAIHYSAATEEEAAPVVAAEAVRKDREQAIREVAHTIQRVGREGEMPNLGHAPEGEVLSADKESSALGYRSSFVLDAQGGLWSVVYDGADGSMWGDGNCGPNTTGHRLQLTPDEIAAFRAALHRSKQ